MILNDVRASLESRIAHIDWMDTKTRQMALAKARAIEQFVGYPEFITNVDKLDKYYQDVSTS